MFEPGAVVELRAFNDGKTTSGYYNDRAALAVEAGKLEDRGHTVYVTLNEVNPALLSRAANRARKVYREPLTSDADIFRRRWLPLDLDPKRPSGVSATDEEKEAARGRASEVREHLKARGWPEPVYGDSGNGYHLLYQVDLPNDAESLVLVRGVLEGLSFKFSDELVSVDTTTSNAARIWKLYGTTARKGDSTKDRPHRRSGLLKVPESVKVVDRRQLEAVAADRPEPPPRDPRRNGHRGDFDLAVWIAGRGVRVKREGPWGETGGYRWILEECPWNGHTDNAAYIVQGSGGWIAAGCQHNSCQGFGWRELREHFEPGAYERNGQPGGSNRNDAEDGEQDKPIAPSAPWPVLADEALHGLAGDVVRAADPHTEADKVAVLAGFLAAVGSVAGRTAHVRVGPDSHYLKLFVGLVGETSKGRKGTSWGPVRDLMRDADGGWVGDRVLGGLSSGEGLIYTVRDRVMGADKGGEEKVVDEGVSDKRLLVLESELASTLKVMGRDGNTLSPVVRQAWDDTRLQVLTKNNPMKATDSHISIVGHITKDELLRHMTETETANGFANRFLWLMVKRSKLLPRGGEWWKVDKQPLVSRITEVLEFGRNRTEIEWGDSAGERWDEVYGPLSEGKPGLFGAVVGRGEAQVLRLAALYAVLDRSETIEDEHLFAALALWNYAEESARYIFGDATGDSVADQIMDALRGAGADGMTRTEVSNLFGRHKNTERINRAFSTLLGAGRVRRGKEETGGRPSERWFCR
jgi:hypothetical protein